MDQAEHFDVLVLGSGRAKFYSRGTWRNPGNGWSSSSARHIGGSCPNIACMPSDFVLRLSSAPVVSIAKIRGRTRGIGNEFVLGCDMRFVSGQSALFGQPEIGVGLVPGGGALGWLPRLVGRSRELEIVLSGDDFDADIAERYGWVNRTLNDAD